MTYIIAGTSWHTVRHFPIRSLAKRHSFPSLQDVLVTYDFGALYLEILDERPHFTVYHGGYVRSDDSYALR